MSADPAYQAWRGQKLVEIMALPISRSRSDEAVRIVGISNARILNSARPVRQPDFAALGLGSADEAAGRN